MSTWLSGDLTGVNPRAELELLRNTVREAVACGASLDEFWTSLADLDPVACAELAAGPRALAEPMAVRSCLIVAPVLEGIMSPSGLYGRLAALAPTEAGNIAAVAARRHPDARWLWRVGRSNPGPLFAVLCELNEPNAVLSALSAGHEAMAVERLPACDAPVLLALYNEVGAPTLERCLAAVLDGGGRQPVVAWLAAWHGPDVDSTFARVALRLATDAGRTNLLRLSSDLPITRRHLESDRG